MEIRLFRYFVAVAEELNFTRASERLHTSQPSLGQQIRQIEDEVGKPLFHRDRHRVQLTEAGRVFLHEARVVLEASERAVTLARQAGSLTIGLPPGAAAKILPRLAPILSQKDIQFVLRTLTTLKQIEALRRREINVGFIYEKNAGDEEITTEFLFSEQLVAIVPASHPLAQMPRVSVKNLAELPLIQVDRNFAPVVHEAMKLVGRRGGVRFRTLLEADSLFTVLYAVASGLGFSLFGAWVELSLPAGAVIKPIDDLVPVPEIEVFVAYRKDDTLPALPIFLKFLRTIFRASGLSQ